MQVLHRNRPPAHRHPAIAHLARLCTLLAAVFVLAAGSATAQSELVSHWSPAAPGIAYGFLGGLTRTGGSATPYQDFTVGVMATARNDSGVNQWAFGVATEAWALKGSASTLVGLEAAVVNEEPANFQPKIALNAVFKNRADGGTDPHRPMNAGSIALWISAQPGTGFERGLVFGEGALRHERHRPAAIDLSDVSDDEIAGIDLIRIRKDVALRWDPVTRKLVLVDTPAPL